MGLAHTRLKSPWWSCSNIDLQTGTIFNFSFGTIYFDATTIANIFIKKPQIQNPDFFLILKKGIFHYKKIVVLYDYLG